MGEAERKLRERENGQEKTAVSLNPYDVQLQIRPATLYRPTEKCRAVIAAALITEKSCLLIDHLIQISIESLAISFFGLPLPLIIELSSHSLPFTYYWYLYKASPRLHLYSNHMRWDSTMFFTMRRVALMFSSKISFTQQSFLLFLWNSPLFFFQ
jgi:hypothetical protein